MDIFDKAYNFTQARIAQAAGLYPFFIPIQNSEGTEALIDGRRLLMFGSNNYLGLTMDPRVRQAGIDAIKEFGPSCTGSRLANGTLELHLELEGRLADFVGKEAALVFSTGYQVNLGAISCLMSKGDFIITDKEAHASIVDASMFSIAELRRFGHNDVDHLERVLKGLDPEAGKLLVVDGVYSVSGDLAPLPELIELCKKYKVRFMVDDAHSIGVMGKGRGTAAHFGVTDDVDLIMGTFSKSFASVGGFIAGDETVIHYIQHYARSMVFSAAIPPSNAAVALAALDIIENEPEHNERLWKNAERMRSGLNDLGFNTGTSVTPIIPIIIGELETTLLAWKRSFEEGAYTNCFIPPGVPEGSSLLRTSYIATHTDDQIDRGLEIFEKVGLELGLIG
ncbi:MAG: pyridoxal phosphate-dependent aminotransferase family protein [Chloroflexi bacterium]|nr:pyridoxal phosphate-dependent aminotransferase family protein [Chloroflexota bacterium]